MTSYVTDQVQVDWVYRVGNFEVNAVQFASFAEVAAAQGNLKARLADLPRLFPEAFVNSIAEVNSYGHNMSKLDKICAEILYYVGEVAEATTAFEIEEACQYFDYIFEDFFSAVETAGLSTETFDAMEDEYM